VSYVYAAGSWSAPNCAPPGCNTEEPINKGSTSQTKEGALTVNSTVTARNLIVKTDISPAVGQVLTASDVDGKVKWSPAGGGSSTGGIKSIIGPLDGSGSANDKSATFSLATQGDVIVYAYANAQVGQGSVQEVKLFSDGNVVRTLGYGEECSENCGGGAASVVLTSRQTLGAGNHTLRVTTGGSVTMPNGGLQFIIHVLN
ncbi:MAG: hypothetical protein AAB683_00630, partial [Patescibacteria group bacterium]